MSVTLFEIATTRSDRVLGTLLELDLPFESREGMAVLGLPELHEIHPLGKVPALRDHGRPLFESAAICAWLADSHPERGLIPAAGTWSRALHDQWVAFTLAELEANLWHSTRNTYIYPEAERVPAVLAQNDKEARRALAVIDTHLRDRAWFVDGRFSVTDIFVGFALHWASRCGLTTEAPHVEDYLRRLRDRPLCPYRPS